MTIQTLFRSYSKATRVISKNYSNVLIEQQILNFVSNVSSLDDVRPVNFAFHSKDLLVVVLLLFTL